MRKVQPGLKVKGKRITPVYVPILYRGALKTLEQLAPAGSTVRELIDNYCGGMQDGHEFRAYLPGGASGGILPAKMDDLPLDFGQLENMVVSLALHAVVILSDQDLIKEASLIYCDFLRMKAVVSARHAV